MQLAMWVLKHLSEIEAHRALHEKQSKQLRK